MKDASAIAARLEHDLETLSGRLQALADEIRQHIQQAGPGPGDHVNALQRVGSELSGCLKRLQATGRH